jgi:tetratricopeptide (TPR) repeat protein
MRRPFSWQLSVLLLLAAMAAQAQVPTAERPLPKLPADHFTACEWNRVGVHPRIDASELTLLTACETQLQAQKRAVLEVCLKPGASAGPPRVIQACTESLHHDLLQGEARSLVLASRAQAYFAYGNDAAALRDLDTSLQINSKLVPALLERARLHTAQGDFSGAVADYSRAILLQPRNAAVWSERGQVNLSQHNYEGAVKDEAQAIQFAPGLARAYYLRSVAFGDLGDQPNAFSDLRTAVGLDPSLARYVTIRRKAVLLALPPL